MAPKVTPENTDDEFVTVSEGSAEPETKIVFEEIGDAFTGEYLGMRTVPSDTGSYQQARFELDGEVYFMNANFSLREGLRSVPLRARTRITWTAEQDTGQASPMRIFKVEVARNTRGVHRRAST